MNAHQIVGDRFIRSLADGWIDLVTGERLPSVSNASEVATSVAARTAARAITEIADVSAIGFRVATIETSASARDVALATALEARGLGFVTLRSSVRLQADAALLLSSRHVLLICWPGDEREQAIWWIRQLSRRSPRGHLLITLIPRISSVVEARERAMTYGVARRQIASARIESALMTNNLVFAKRAALEQIDLCADPEPHLWLVGAAAHAAMLLGEFGEAEALLAGASAEAWLRQSTLPIATQVRQTEHWFWSGKFNEIPAFARSLDEPELIGWTGLAGWARGDAASFECSRVTLLNRHRSDPHGRFWAALLSAISPDKGGLDLRLTRLQVTAEACGLPRRARALAQAVAAEACLAARDPAAARLVLARREPGAAPLDGRLLDWLRAACQAEGAGTSLRARIRRMGANGIVRWGMGDKSMHLVHGLPALMQLVQDADDELAALTGGCAWVRRHTGADRVAIVDADATELLAADGWTSSDLFELKAATSVEMARETGALATVWAPIRYGRVTIGRAVARGRIETRAAVEPATQALAALIAPALRTRLDALALSRQAHAKAPEILGRSASIAAAREAIGRAAATAFPVLIEGESGTGKELVARALHRLSPRRDRAFSAINCAALNDDLVEAEMFGHVRGAFTGAVGPRMGLVEQAHGGTLFLDEVGELSARAQAKLLRVLQEREIRRVGENAARHVDIRIVAATNKPLAEAARTGRFREDLLFRLAVVRIRVPPLRDRLEDVPLLAHAFWRRMQADTGKSATLGPDALAALCRHPWPGNIRELQNAMAALAVVAPTRGRVTHRHVRQVVTAAPAFEDESGVPLETARRLFEQRVISAALARNGGRRVATAHELGLTRQGLAKALRRLGLSTGGDSVGVA